MIISPWIFGYSHMTSATTSAVISGVVVLILGGIRFFTGFSGMRSPAVSH